ncbi:MAG: DUF2269 family protein [Burkholderiales bacterium]|jgi:hypothetical protein|nr:DUF2269 family protein [Burkholderiales bacterium]MCA3215613.1 DUF2269 family protein [Burkholderiales bacterium]MCA3226574.1 DUF2269 family protein [Burkholderiales bacterium]MCE2645876.1 DUF2269 family protein [Burkholderiaceae bacterium]
MRRSLKFIHTVGTATLLGTLALQLVIAFRYNALLAGDDAVAAGARQVMVEVTRWVMGPSLVVVIVTGLLLMGLNRSFASAYWVWAKALIGLLLVKAVITVNDPVVHELMALVAQGIAGKEAALAELARLARMEWLGAWLSVALCVAAVAFGVWRPTLEGKPKAASRTSPADRPDDPDAVPSDAPAERPAR